MIGRSKLRTYADAVDRLKDLDFFYGELMLGLARTRSAIYPTLRWSEPAYALFTSTFSVVSRDGVPRQGSPESWVAVSAANLRLLTLSRVDIFSFAPGRHWETVELPQTKITIEERQSQIAIFDELMNQVTPSFFGGEDTHHHERSALTKLLDENISKPIFEQTRCLAPDFFEWLYEPIRLNDQILR